jgi:hypothetical protein
MWNSIAAATFIAIAGAALEARAAPVIEGNKIVGVRNARYCEIIPIVRDGLRLKSLSYGDLATLGAKLKLPSGWRYSPMVIEKDLVLGAAGTATVIQDELENTYQKID